MNSTLTSGNGGDSGADLSAQSGGEAREKLMSDMKNVIHDAEDWLSKTGAQSGEEMRAVKQRFETTLRTAKTDLMKLEANMMARTKLAAQATDTYVKDHPWKSVGLGAAVGVVFGLLIARR
jgi:ElaB/YqjD/DUF883 family membrane-anchored ribosome-binding protein